MKVDGMIANTSAIKDVGRTAILIGMALYFMALVALFALSNIGGDVRAICVEVGACDDGIYREQILPAVRP